MRKTTRPSTAKCTLPQYIGFLISEPKSPTCTRLSEVAGISHDSVNRFLERENDSPRDLFDESRKELNLEGGVLSVDDSVLDKPYSQHIGLVGFFWSGKHHKTVKGINIITLYYTDNSNRNMPINDRIYDASENKTKNQYFIEMLNEIIEWGVRPSCVTGDSWYSCTKNLKKIRNHQIGFTFGIEKNRLVSLEKGSFQQVQQLDVPPNGLKAWLKDFGHVQVFQTRLKNQPRYYIVDEPTGRELTQQEFLNIHNTHWQIEQYHRAIKQVCHAERFQVRRSKLVRNHIFASLLSFVHLQKMIYKQKIINIYQHQRALFKRVVECFIHSFAEGKEYLLPQIVNGDNA